MPSLHRLFALFCVMTLSIITVCHSAAADNCDPLQHQAAELRSQYAQFTRAHRENPGLLRKEAIVAMKDAKDLLDVDALQLAKDILRAVATTEPAKIRSAIEAEFRAEYTRGIKMARSCTEKDLSSFEQAKSFAAGILEVSVVCAEKAPTEVYPNATWELYLEAVQKELLTKAQADLPKAVRSAQPPARRKVIDLARWLGSRRHAAHQLSYDFDGARLVVSQLWVTGQRAGFLSRWQDKTTVLTTSTLEVATGSIQHTIGEIHLPDFATWTSRQTGWKDEEVRKCLPSARR